MRPLLVIARIVVTFGVLGSSSSPTGRLIAGSESSTCGPSAATVGDTVYNLGDPVDVAVGPNVIYVLEKSCSRVSQWPIWTKAESQPSPLEGTISAGGQLGGFFYQFQEPSTMYYSQSLGVLFVADTGNSRIMKWTPGVSPGTIVLRGNGYTREGDIAEPIGVFEQYGVVYVSEKLNHRVQMFELSTCCGDPQNAAGKTLFGCPELIPPLPPPAICSRGWDLNRLREPSNLFVTPSGLFYVSDTSNHRVLMFFGNETRTAVDWQSNVTVVGEVVAGTTGIPGCGQDKLREPRGIFVDDDGFLFVADTGNHRVQKFAPGERKGMTVAGDCCCNHVDGHGLAVGGSALNQLDTPVAIAIDTASSTLYVADRGNHRVLAFDSTLKTFDFGCMYGVSCNITVNGMIQPSISNQILIAHRKVEVPPPADNRTASTESESNVTSPCGSPYCTFPSWPGFANPQKAQGSFIDTYPLGIPQGPPSNSSTDIGEYVLCFGASPTTPCLYGDCIADDHNCSNSSSWVCGGAEPFGLRREAWFSLAGETITDLVNSSFPELPSLVEITTATTLRLMESPSNFAELYGQRLFGLFIAPQSGIYTFHITSDDNSELWIVDKYHFAFRDDNSTFTGRGIGTLIAKISEDDCNTNVPLTYCGYTGPADWSLFPSQQGNIILEAGEMYWLEALHKQGTGYDHLKVGVTLPDGSVHKPIPVEFFTAKECTNNIPSGIGVVHTCGGSTTGQSCLAECGPGYAGQSQKFFCNGVGDFVGSHPICTTITCEQYDIELGTFFMHGTLGYNLDVACFGNTDCLPQYQKGSGSWPFGMHIDEDDNLILCDTLHHKVVRWQGRGLRVTYEVLAGGNGKGNATNQLNWPAGVFTVGVRGPLYIADTRNHRIVRWDKDATEGVVVVGNGTEGRTLSELSYPTGVFVDTNGTIVVWDTGNARVMRYVDGVPEVLEDGIVNQYSGLPIAFPAAHDTFMDGEGHYYAAEYGNHQAHVCYRKPVCVHTRCKDVDPDAEEGPECGCSLNMQCENAHGKLPGSEMGEYMASTKWPMTYVR